MVNRFQVLVVILLIVSLVGCGNLSPKLKKEVQNQQGRIDEMQDLQNSMNMEIGNVKKHTEITAGDVKNLQEGLINQNNSGVQILQGSGGLIFAFAVITIVLLLAFFYYRDKAIKQEKALKIIGEEIARFNNLDLENNVFAAAMHTDVEQEVLRVIKLGQAKYERI